MRFQVFIKGELADAFQVNNGYLFGSDGIAIRQVDITFENGCVVCKKPNIETSGLSILWPVSGFGKIMLQTSCLSERDRPYIINVELARAKLMQIITNCEQWSLGEKFGDIYDIITEARELFIKSLQHIHEPVVAAGFADQSLEISVGLSEDLANKQAAEAFEKRGHNRGFGRACLGCRVNPVLLNDEKYAAILTKFFGFLTIPVNWARIEPVPSQYDFTVIDRCIEMLAPQKSAISMGPLLCFSKPFLPKWLLTGDVSFEKIRDFAYRFVEVMVKRYYGSVRAWRVTRGLNVFNHFGFNFEQVLEMTRAANMAVKAITNRSLKIIDLSNPWGEYYSAIGDTIPPLVYMDMIIQSGIKFEAFGISMQFGKNAYGMHIRDMMNVSSMLDCFGRFAKPIHIIDLEIPSIEEGTSSSGQWHQKWTEHLQAQWLDQFYKIALSKPFVDTVSYANLTNTPGSILPESGLLTDKFKPKKAFEVVNKLHSSIFKRS